MSQFEVDLTMLPLTIPEFAVKFKLENQSELELRDSYMIYLTLNRNGHHYGEHEHMSKWYSHQVYILTKGKY